MKDSVGLKSRYKLDFIVPQRPILSVVQGAAFLGITPNFVRARKLKYTYGVVVEKLKRFALRDDVPTDYIEQNEYQRKNDGKINKLLEKVNHKNTSIRAYAERSVLKVLKGDCSTAVGIYSLISKKKLILKAELFSTDGKDRYYYEYSDKINRALNMGKIVGKHLKKISLGKYKN